MITFKQFKFELSFTSQNSFGRPKI